MPQAAPQQNPYQQPSRIPVRLQQMFNYTPTNPVIIAQGASATYSVTLQADYDFACKALSITIIDSTSAVVLPANSTALIQIQDTGAGANWFSAPVGVSSIFGNGQLPGVMVVERIIAKTATLNFTINNIKDGAAVAGATYYLTLQGAKLLNSSVPIGSGLFQQGAA